MAPVPGAEIPNHRSPARIWRPDGKAHPGNPVHQHRVPAQATSQVAVLAFGQQIHIEFTQQRAERVGILGFLYWPAPVDPQQVGAGARARSGEQTGIAHRAQRCLEARLVAGDSRYRKRSGHHDAQNVTRRGALPPQHREWIEAAALDDSLDRGCDAQIVIHAEYPRPTR